MRATMIKVDFHKIGTVPDNDLAFAVICSELESEWIWVKNKNRQAWEIPGGKREPGEDILNTAKRELLEETGAREFEIVPVCEYSVTKENQTKFGQLFYAKIKMIDFKPTDEIEAVKTFTQTPKELSFPAIQPYLLEKVKAWKEEQLYKTKETSL